MQKLKILCPEPENFSEKGLQLMASIGHLDAVPLSQQDFEVMAPDYDILAVRLQLHITAEIIHSSKKLQVILSPTTGTDHIDIKSAKDANIKIFSLKGENVFLESVYSSAEHTFALLLSLIRYIPSSFDSVKRFEWVQGPFRGHELHGKVLGILGFGRIGKKMAHYANAFGMDVVYFDPYVDCCEGNALRLTETEEFYNRSEILTIHVPLDHSTHSLVGKKEIEMLPRDAFIVNTARGAIVDYSALLRALETEHIAGAAIDVLTCEPTLNDIDLQLIEYSKTHNNLIITSHIAGATWESIEKTDVFVIEKLKDWLF
ncbi:MAG: NAD(P)-dependent oxidoreductase [Methanoregulaceae archaeon]